MIDHQLSRRLFLRNCGVLSAAGAAAAPLALNMAAIGSAAAQSAGDYKALVCLFLFGGNDSLNTILPTDSASWANYTTVRNQEPDSIALMAPSTAAVVGAAAGTPARLGGVLPIAPTTARTAPGGGTQTFALHPLLGSLQTMFNTDKRLVSNVGPLVEPLTKDTYNNGKGRRLAMLFSHNDQTNTWMSSRPEGATVGWGGRGSGPTSLFDCVFRRSLRRVARMLRLGLVDLCLGLVHGLRRLAARCRLRVLCRLLRGLRGRFASFLHRSSGLRIRASRGKNDGECNQ